MHDRAIYRAIPIMQKEVLVGPSKGRNLTAKTAPWANMFFAKEIHQIGISSRNFSSPFASKSHRLLVVGGYNDPVALGILGNGIQHHVERSIVTSQTQAKGVCVKESQSPRRPGLVCPLPPHPPVICVLPAGVDGVLAALFLCQLPLFIHVRPPYQLHTQTEPLHLRQAQSFQHKRPGLLIGNSKRKKKNRATPASPVLLVMCGNCNVYLQVTLIRVPDPGAIFVKFLHHCHGDKRESRVHVGVLGVNQDSHFVHTRLDKTGSQKSISQRWREMVCHVTAAVFCVRLYLCYCVESLQCTEELNTLTFV